MRSRIIIPLYEPGNETNEAEEFRQSVPADPPRILTRMIGNHVYLWFYKDSQKHDVVRSLGKFAADPHLNLNWRHVASISKEIRRAS